MYQSKMLVCRAILLVFVLWHLDTYCVHAQKQRIVAGDARTSEEEAEERIRLALEKECQIEVVEIPFSELFEEIEDTFRINIELDTRALEVVGLGSDTPITRNLSGISLRSALQLILRDLELTWMVHHGSLLITTPEEAEASLLLRVYEVSDIVVDQGAKPLVDVPDRDRSDFDSLIEVITATVEPESWDEVGGPASIEALHYSGKNVLIISQTRDVHEQIEALLDQLRDIRKQASAESRDRDAHAGDSRPEEAYVRVYPISGRVSVEVQELAELIEVALGSDIWEKGTFVSGIANTVVVRHDSDVHQSIRRLLDDLGARPNVGEAQPGQNVPVSGGLFSLGQESDASNTARADE